MREKDYIWNTVTCSCENGKHLGNITGDPVTTCDEIIETTESTSAKTFLTKNTSTKSSSKSFYILLAILLITRALSIAVSIYCYPLKYQVKQKHLLPYQITNGKLKEVLY